MMRPEIEGSSSRGRNPLLEGLPLSTELDMERGPAMPSKDTRGMVRLPGNRCGSIPKDLAPVTMERKVNPYSDVPSLYDLYVQVPSGLAQFLAALL
jgi:hypothetical protein